MNQPKELTVVLMKPVEAGLQIVLCQVSAETYLSSRVGRGVVIGGGEIHVVGGAVVVGRVAMIERGNREKDFGVERVHPGKIYQRIRFMIAVAQANALSLRLKAVGRDVSVLNVTRKGIVGNLVVVLPRRRDEAQLVGRIDVENERPKPAKTVRRVVHHFRNRRLQAQVATVSVHAGVVSEALGMATEAELAIRLVEVPGVQYQLHLVISLES